MNKERKPREIIVLNKNENASKWDKVEQLSKIFSLIGVPLIVGLIGLSIQNELSNKTVNKDYVQISISILTNPETIKSSQLREWAIAMINKTSPIPFSETVSNELIEGKISLPKYDFDLTPSPNEIETDPAVSLLGVGIEGDLSATRKHVKVQAGKTLFLMFIIMHGLMVLKM